MDEVGYFQQGRSDYETILHISGSVAHCESIDLGAWIKDFDMRCEYVKGWRAAEAENNADAQHEAG